MNIDLFKYTYDYILDKEKEKDLWGNSKYETFKQLSNDGRGFAGEMFIKRMFELNENLIVTWDGDANTDPVDGIYDIKIGEELFKGRFEVKTGSLNNDGKSFQFEGVKPGKCDFTILFSVLPNELYITVINSKWDYTSKLPHLNRAPTLRQGQQDQFKITIGMNNILNAVKEGSAIKLDLNNKQKTINFLKKYV